MPRGKKSKLPSLNKQSKMIATRLIEISLKVDDYVYKSKPIFERDAKLYLNEISAYRALCIDDVRSLQVIEKLTRCMESLISEHKELATNACGIENGQFTYNESKNARIDTVSPVYSITDEDRSQLTQELATDNTNQMEILEDDNIMKQNKHDQTALEDNVTEITNTELPMYKAISNLSIEDTEDPFLVATDIENPECSQSIIQNILETNTPSDDKTNHNAQGTWIEPSKLNTQTSDDGNLAAGINTNTLKLDAQTSNIGNLAAGISTSTLKLDAQALNDGNLADGISTNTVTLDAQASNDGNSAAGFSTNTLKIDTQAPNDGNLAARISTNTLKLDTQVPNDGKLAARISTNTLKLDTQAPNDGNFAAGISMKTSQLDVKAPNDTQPVDITNNCNLEARNKSKTKKPCTICKTGDSKIKKENKKPRSKKKIPKLNENEQTKAPSKPTTPRKNRKITFAKEIAKAGDSGNNFNKTYVGDILRNESNIRPEVNNSISIYNETVENDLSWIENLRYVREVAASEYDPKLVGLADNFWNNCSLPDPWNDDDFSY